MSTRTDPPQISSYLAQLRHEAHSRLRADIADELVADVRADLADRIPAGATQAQISAALDRLGSPRVLVDAAQESAEAPRTHNGWVEPAALTLLIGSVLGIFLIYANVVFVLIVGLILVLMSSRWSVKDKAWATITYALFGGPTLLIMLFGRAVSYNEPPPLWVGWSILAVMVALNVYTPIRLIRGARRRQV